MPELPDVETFRRYLAATSLHQRIASVTHVDERILDDISVRTLQRHVRDAELESTRRHGKHLFAELSSGEWLVMHFGMTGFLRYYKGKERPGELDHVRARFDFANDYHLAFDCQRLFGSITLTKSPDHYVEEKRLGIDALDVTAADFTELISTVGTSIKSLLMDQKRLAGIGNVYSDEILFQARLDPRTHTTALDGQQVGTLYDVLRRVLLEAVDAHAEPGRMPDGWLTPRRAPEAVCPVCGGTVERHQVGGRTAYLCPHCQRQPD